MYAPYILGLHNVTFNNLTYSDSSKTSTYIFEYISFTLDATKMDQIFSNFTLANSELNLFIVNEMIEGPGEASIVIDEFIARDNTFYSVDSMIKLDQYVHEGKGTLEIRNSLFERNNFVISG